MNLGGASNVDLTEAARLLKQSAVGAGAGVQSQQVPPPMMLMQQAVAMQQFQFQQALLMQQVMATQQAAARAATVKSAQEMAAARAAEISKLLKGNEPEVEEEKKSPGRSMSRTPSRSRSRSRSRSFSRSKSRSPLRYRRDRSASRSPIRYRRDSRPSPISREYFGYRGRSRRGYYRGRGEYAWNPSYRRDWERERDHYSSRSRRSRSRSRSRVRRRSHTRSRSPRPRRDRSGTPLRYRREERRSGRSSRRSRSVEVRPTPSRSSRSRSRSLSRSRSRSRSESLHLKHGSQSPVRRSRDTRSGGGQSKEEKMSPVPSEGRRTLMSSPDTKGSKEKNYSDDITDDKEGILEQLSPRAKGSDQQSISPARSLSVSLSPPRRKNGGALEGVSKSNDWKKAMLRETLVQKIDEVITLAEQSHCNKAPSVMGIDGGECSPAALLEQEIDTKGAFKSKGGDFVGKVRHAKKESGRMELSSDESDGNKEVDDWRDDIKANELEKIKRMESKREMERREGERKALPVQVVVQEEVKCHGMTLLEHLGRGTGKLSVESPFAPEVQGVTIAAFKSKKDISSNDLVSVEPSYSDEIRVNGSRDLLFKEEILDRVSTGNGEGDADMDEEAGDVTHEKSIGSADVSDREEDSDVVFEGPLPPQDEDPNLEDGKRSLGSSKGEDSGEEIGAEEPPSVLEEEIVGNPKGKDKSKSREDEDVRGLQRGKDKSRVKDDDEFYENRKSKEKSRSRERSRSKRHDDDTDHERRKDRHRKHRRRHRRDEETEIEEDEDDDKRDVDSSKDKEERRRHHRSKKHRSGRDHKEDKREKKRRRHKHRGKSPSESPDKESLVVVEGEDVDQVAGRVHKRKSSNRENRRKGASKSPVHASGSGSD
ncbi:hypothetical protein KC19_10G104700 [Ceratodon purpureus]|uniref:Uncharacterized protein n=1 Tax=Ceratodon purpureus TaxID=3225 RepID=A0A8T0GIU7_CERPU|nr:hypothetical protein KC19_10G104700 [Ceratodon purpureus]